MIDVVIDGQFGSTGKGKLAAYLMAKGGYTASICDFNVNAGHTVVWDAGVKDVLQQLPVGALFGKRCILGPGCGIDISRLLEEIDRYQADVRIHPRACIIGPGDREAESEAGSSTMKISSTMKGCGHALCGKVMRLRTQIAASYADDLGPYLMSETEVDNLQEYVSSQRVLGETAQGVWLSLDSRFYPFCTSRNVGISAALDRFGGIHPNLYGVSFLSMRTFPIRVGGVKDPESGEAYSSGEIFPDQKEIGWGEIPSKPEPERTTVTNRIRRIFTWSPQMYAQTMKMTFPKFVFINFANYLEPKCEGMTMDDFDAFKNEVLPDSRLRSLLISCCNLATPSLHKFYIGTGPRHSQMIELSVYDAVHEGE